MDRIKNFFLKYNFEYLNYIFDPILGKNFVYFIVKLIDTFGPCFIQIRRLAIFHGPTKSQISASKSTFISNILNAKGVQRQTKQNKT